MPLHHTCDDHPAWPGSTALDGVIAHLGAQHPDATTEAAIVDGPIRTKFTDQATAQGNTPLRIMGCRVCGGTVETRDPDRDPYCDEHLPEVA